MVLVLLLTFSLHAETYGGEFFTIQQCVQTIKMQTHSSKMKITTDKPDQVSGFTSTGLFFDCSVKRTGTKGTFVYGYYMTEDENKGLSLFPIIIGIIFGVLGLIILFALISEKQSNEKFDKLVKLIQEFDISNKIVDYMGTKAIYLDKNSKKAILFDTDKQQKITESVVEFKDIEKIEIYDNYKLIMTTCKESKIQKSKETTTNFSLKISGKSLLNGEFKLFLANPKSKKGDVLHEAYFSKIEEIFTTLSEYIEN